MSYIERTITSKILKAAREYPVISLTGPRQSGKTTLVKKIFPEKKYVSLEDLDVRAFASDDPRGFLSSTEHGMIIDEAQRVPELFSYIQGIVDSKKNPGQFVLTGSQNFLLLESITQSLAGRVSMHTLLPMSIEELSPFFNNDEYLPMLLKGFFPRLHTSEIDPHDWYANYITTYVERDVRQIKNIVDLHTFQQFLKLCAGRVGQLLNMSSLANDCGISHNTAKAWLSVLVASHVIYLLQPSQKSFRKRLVKMPKLYIVDPGLVCSLLEIENVAQLSTHPLRGNIFETMIIMEFVKYYYHRGGRPKISFWRDKTGHEIDCLIHDAGQMFAIEIKSGKTINEEYFKDLEYFSALQKENKSFIIYGGSEGQKRSRGMVLPWSGVATLLK